MLALAACGQAGTYVAATGVTLSTASATVAIGATQQLVATIEPTNATVLAARWASSDATIVTVSAEGLLTALTAGSATVTATTRSRSSA